LLLLCGLVLSSTLPGSPPEPARERTTSVRGEKLPELGFERLSAFPYIIIDAGTGATPAQIDEARKRGQIPPWLQTYNGRRVVLTGYLLPLQMENGRAKKFILMRDVTTCCYGATPNMNDYVIVSMKGEGAKADQDIPVMVAGVFNVEETYDNGYVVSLFHMDGEVFLGPRT